MKTLFGKIQRFVRLTYFAVIELRNAYWKILLTVILASLVALGGMWYIKLTQAANDEVEEFTVEQTTISLVYPDKIDTNGEGTLKLLAGISETVTISQTVNIALYVSDPHATITDSQFTTILSTTHRTEQWTDVSLTYGQPRSAPSTLEIDVVARVNQKPDDTSVEIRIDSFSEKVLSLGGAILSFFGIVGTVLGVWEKMWKLLSNR
jgi:hypothetical protein